VRPAIADRMWDDQQSLHRELSCMSACKIFLAVELLLWVLALYNNTAAWNHLKWRGSRPNSRITHQEGVVSLTIRILLSTVTCHFVKGCPFLCPIVRMGWPKSGLHTYQQGLRTFKEPRGDMQPACKVMFPFELFNADSTCCEWT